MMTQYKLYYVYDPMCSWCWGFQPVWKQITEALEGVIEVQYVVGGLAPDSNEPMPIEMQQQIASYWKKIESFLGTEFNYEFWTKNSPRRSTYPSCRAALAARKQNQEVAMVSAIQKAYYLEAKNPSDDHILLELAQDLGLNIERFKEDYFSDALNQALFDEIKYARSIGGNSFPSLFVHTSDSIIELPINYQDAKETIEQVKQLLSLK